jgi:two-component system sensor histidine kinase PhoQ
MLLLVVVQVLWLLWTLKPLRTLKQELEKIEQGKLDRLQNNYPEELTQVTNQLNLLLATEQGQRKRYRNALADLAHSLKTPLAVIQSQGELTKSSYEQLENINKIIEHQLKRAQSAGESSWHIGVKVDDVLTKLLNSLAKIYHDKALTFTKSYHEENKGDAVFKGDEADLLELLGNLLDNACKAASTSVLVEIKRTNKSLSITISDDGLGLSDKQRAQVLHRGTRADTYQKGHGIGLAIVRDLVSSYQGELSIGHSVQLGGAEFILRFNN